MFKHFFLFELKYRLQRPLVYIFFLVNFLLIFAATVSDNVTISGGGNTDAVNLNAPHTIMALSALMSLIGIFMTTAFINTAALRDFENKFDGILFSAPISKFGYLGGRFAGAYVMALVPFLGVFAGIALGAMSPLVEASEVSSFTLMPYINAFFIIVVPNILLISGIVFLLAALFRSTMVSFLGAVGILVVYILMLSTLGNLDNEKIAILFDPLAVNSYNIITKYWTVAEKNTELLAFSGPIIWNRLLWIFIAVGALLLTYVKFSFALKSKKPASSIQDVDNLEQVTNPTFSILKRLPKVQVFDDFATSWKQFVFQTKMEFKGITKSLPFMILLLMGVLNMIGAMGNADEMSGTGNHPVTYLMVESIRNSLFLFLNAIIMYYAGVLVWRERDAKMNEFFDASPFANWIPFMSKLFGMIGMIITILLIAIGCGVLVQAFKGYTNFEFFIYLKELLVYDLSWLTVLTIVALLLQTLLNNKYIGYFAFLLVAISILFGPGAFKVSTNLLFFGTPHYVYSDMNAWSLFAKSLAWFHTYWALFAGLLGLLSILFWVRGKSLTFGQRITIAKQRFQGKIVLATIALGLLWLGTGSFLLYQTKVVNTIPSSDVDNQKAYDYEKKYKQYQHIAQPRIIEVDYEINIYPEERDFDVKALLKAKNKTAETISQLHFTLTNDYPTRITIPGATLVNNDSILNYRIYDLAKPLSPGEELEYEVRAAYVTKGIENEISNSNIVKSGTFLTNGELIPVIGYNERRELSDKKKRAKRGLPFKPGMSELHRDCGASCQNTYISSDSDWVKVKSTLSTSEGQIAIAPGTLTKEWTENNRHYFTYELKKPVLNFYSFVSGIYEVAREEWVSPEGEKVDLEVYYHKGHEYNIDKMMASLRHSLAYYSKHFTPYPHEQARIIEFPRYESFAQAFPGTMPYSESMGFISNLNEKDAIDMVYYVVAHEMAHQWWAHQVIGGRVQGATMLSETFAQYSALMVMEEAYGKDKMKQFMRYEMDKYLRSRGLETRKELPLMFTENQAYIHYRKGSVVMYALQDYIGADSLNAALRRFAEAVAYQEAPYTNTYEVMDFISEVTPDSLQYLLDDMFRTITLYSNKTNTATVKELADNKYEVTVHVSVEKFSADSLGTETLIPHDDFIDIGVFSSEKNEGEKYGKPILIERHKISTPDTSFTFVVDEVPHEAGIDPNYLLVDRFPEDNMMKLEFVD